MRILDPLNIPRHLDKLIRSTAFIELYNDEQIFTEPEIIPVFYHSDFIIQKFIAMAMILKQPKSPDDIIIVELTEFIDKDEFLKGIRNYYKKQK
jgi:hypothetical protein